MKCEKCKSLLINHYEDVFCPLCGWRPDSYTNGYKITVKVGNGKVKHFDAEVPKDLRSMAKWLKVCYGSQRVGQNLRETLIRCSVCMRELPPTKAGRTPKHYPSKWFFEEITRLISLVQSKKARNP